MQKRANLRLMAVAAMVVLIGTGSALAFSGSGSGTEGNPFVITNINELQEMQNDLDAFYMLGNDIDASETAIWNGGAGFKPVEGYEAAFRGSFDGKGYRINDLYIKRPYESFTGLFGEANGAQIKNVLLENAYVSGRQCVGGLVGSVKYHFYPSFEHSRIINCSVTGNIVGSSYDTGGIVGFAGDITITGCHFSGTIQGYVNIGGIVGYLHRSCSLENSYAVVDITEGGNAGGLVGLLRSNLSNCYAMGRINAPSAGGLVGNFYGDGTVYVSVSNSYSTVIVNQSDGGLIGGGLIGRKQIGGVNIYNSYWDKEVSGLENMCGTGTCDDFYGKTTAEMQTKSTFTNAGWNFESVWWMLEGAGYPRFCWEVKYDVGSGRPNDPYLIYTAEQMNTIGACQRDWDKHFKLMDDIDLSGFPGTTFNIIGTSSDNPFTGVFDGNGHTISNFTYNSAGTDYIGIFGFVKGEIKDLGLIDANVNGGTGKYVGTIIGGNSGTINNCYSTGSVVSDTVVGGLVGFNLGTITNCYSITSVTGDWYAGGLVGMNWSGTITNCRSSAGVTGATNVGGLVGWIYGGTITNCYSTGSVKGDYYVGGLVGGNDDGAVIASFWDIEASGQATSDGGGTGLTTAEMKTARTFLVWVCGSSSIWTIDDGNDYPRLWWENMPGEPITIPSYGSGSGEPNDPYLIYTAEQLNTIGLIECIWDKHFKLMADVDLSGLTGTSFNIIGTNWNNAFRGTFDGYGHTISNFTYSSTDRDNIGLFGCLRGENAEIKVLGLIDTNVDGGTGTSVGTLVGRLFEGKVTNCYVDGRSVSGGEYIGGLVGSNKSGKINYSYSTTNVSGDRYIGGLVGYDYSGVYTGSFWDHTVNPLLTGIGNAVDPNVIGESTANMQTESTFTDAGWDLVGETVNGIKDIWFVPQQNYPRLWREGMEISMKLTPRILNCRSYGNWVKAHLTLPQGFTVADVDSNRPAVLHSFGFESAPLYVFVNENERVQIEAAFEREEVCSLAGDWPQALTVAGFLADGNIFLGTSTVRIIHPGLKEIRELALYWLNEDCVQPGWCNQIDMNRDSLVNLLDYALIININIEFVTDD